MWIRIDKKRNMLNIINMAEFLRKMFPRLENTMNNLEIDFLNESGKKRTQILIEQIVY